MEKRKALMIINPRAGKMNFRGSFYSVVKLFSDNGYSVNPYFTTAQGDAARVAHQSANEYDRIIACGGDGTLNEVLLGLSRAALPVKIGYIPCGSTNDFASTLGIPAKPIDAAKQILNEKFITMDLGRFNDRIFTYTASFGAFTAASYNTPQNMKNALGHFAYILSAAKQLPEMKPIKMKITSDDYCEEGLFLYGGVSNTTSIGGVYTLPEEDVDLCDGRLELFLVRKPKSGGQYVNMLLNIAARNYEDPNITLLHTKNVKFESPDPVPYTLDGEFGKAHTCAEISCLDRAYTINGNLTGV